MSRLRDTAKTVSDPQYKGDKEELKKLANEARVAAIVGLALSIGLFAVGLPMSSKEGLFGNTGTGMISVSLPLGFFSYNGLRFAENIFDISNNPTAYKNHDTLKKKLNENTIGVSPLINLFADSI